MQTLLTIVTTAVLTYCFTLAVPYVKRKYNALKSSKKRKALVDDLDTYNTDILVERINELEQQVNNIAEQLATRDKNRRNNIRRDVRDYLSELKNS